MISGLGIEMVEVAPFETLLQEGAEELGERFTDQELAYCRARRTGGQSLAGRQAAKVATLKALGLEASGAQHFRAIEVVKAPSGQPVLELLEPLRTIADRRGVVRVHLSLSHSGGFAVAMVVAERGTEQEGGG